MESRIPDGFREASGSSIHLNGPFRGFQMIQTEVRKTMKVQGDRTGGGGPESPWKEGRSLCEEGQGARRAGGVARKMLSPQDISLENEEGLMNAYGERHVQNGTF